VILHFRLDDNHDGDSGEHGRYMNFLRFANKLQVTGIHYNLFVDTIDLRICREMEKKGIWKREDVGAFMKEGKNESISRYLDNGAFAGRKSL